VALALVNVLQVVALAYISTQQAAASRERIRRSAAEDARHMDAS
jgi:hypothetical protein